MPKKRPPQKKKPSKRDPAKTTSALNKSMDCKILRKQLDMVRQVAGGMRKGMAYYEILKLVLRCIGQAVPGDRLSVFLVDEGERTIAREIAMDSHSHIETGHRGKTFLAETARCDLSDIIFKKKETIVSRKASGEFPNVAKVPLETSGKVVGVLVSERRAGKRPFSPDEVETLLTFATQAGFVLENIRLHYELVQLAFKDELTGQYNHRFFIKRLREEVDRAIRYQHPFTVVIAGFDGFTAFNNQYGYALGDKVLKEWGQFLRKSHRACDLVARISGDRFGVFLPETPLSGAQVVAEKICKAMEGFAFTEDDGLREVRDRLSVSVGIAEFPNHGLMLEQILDHAHRALDEAKARGGNQAFVLPLKVQEPA